MLRIGFDHRRERLLACTGVNNTRLSILILDCFSRHKIQNIHERKRGFVSAERRSKMSFNFYTPVQWFCFSLVHIHERTQMDTTRIWIEFVPWMATWARRYKRAGWTRSSPSKAGSCCTNGDGRASWSRSIGISSQSRWFVIELPFDCRGTDCHISEFTHKSRAYSCGEQARVCAAISFDMTHTDFLDISGKTADNTRYRNMSSHLVHIELNFPNSQL
jgi:hypothetical protein